MMTNEQADKLGRNLGSCTEALSSFIFRLSVTAAALKYLFW